MPPNEDEPRPKRVFRAMRKDANGLPMCGPQANMLGVRPGMDIKPDANDCVRGGGGGLSVTPDDPARLPPHVRPAQFGGKGELPVFELGLERLGATLRYRPDRKSPDRHGFIEPHGSMTLPDYQSMLGATQGDWEEFK